MPTSLYSPIRALVAGAAITVHSGERVVAASGDIGPGDLYVVQTRGVPELLTCAEGNWDGRVYPREVGGRVRKAHKCVHVELAAEAAGAPRRHA